MTEVSPAARQEWPALTGLARDVSLEILTRGPLPRRELAARFGVSAATLTRTVAPLLDAQVLTELAEPLAGRLGRPARLLDVSTSDHQFVGVKLSADTIDGVLTDIRASVHSSGQAALQSQEPAVVARGIAQLVEELDTTGRARAVGISFGGVSRDGRTVSRAPFLGWADVPLARLVEDRTGRQVVLENDLVALTGAELWFGDGRLLHNFAVLTVGAGVGYGLVVHDRVVTHPDVGVGLVGHFPLDADGPRCPAGHRGCADAMLTTSGISAQVSLAHRRPVGFEEVLTLAQGGDAAASAVIESAGRSLGRLVAAVANLALPERIFLSGEGIGLTDIAGDAMREELAAHREPAASPVDLVIQPYESDLWARGAAAIAVQHHVLGPSAREGARRY